MQNKQMISLFPKYSTILVLINKHFTMEFERETLLFQEKKSIYTKS